MNPMDYNKNPRYESLYTSGEILKAIETIAGDSVLDGDSRAYKLWAAATPEQDELIADLAWSYADSDVDTLYWGNCVAFKR